METITTELVETGAKRDARGRRLAARREREAVMAAYEKSGLTQREFAQREGIKFFTFTGWLRRHQKTAVKRSFAEVKMAARPPAAVLEVALPGGLVIRGSEVEAMAALVRALRAC